MKTVDQHIENSLISRSAQLLNGDALDSLRKRAIKDFEVLGLPERKTEAYKYTHVKRILEKNFDFTLSNSDEISWTKEECQQLFYQDEKATHLVFVNGAYQPDYSLIRNSKTALDIQPVDNQTMANSSDLSNYFGKIASLKDPFALLNTLSFHGGIFMHSKKSQDEQVVYVYHFLSAKSQLIAMPRVLTKVDSNSHLRVYEKTFRKGDHNTLTNSLIEAKCEKNASLRWTKLQNYTPADYSIEGFYATQYRDSRIYTNTLSFKGGLIRNNLNIYQEEEHCETHMHGLYQIGHTSHVDNNTSVDHRKPNSFSNELYKGIVDEKAHAVFNGKIYVRPQAQKTNAFQSNNNILLSELATVNTKPQLEIWADDVKCSHGCTTGQLDEEAIFYLRSRGISKTKAKSLMLNAFAGEALVEITNELVRDEIESIILNKLGT